MRHFNIGDYYYLAISRGETIGKLVFISDLPMPYLFYIIHPSKFIGHDADTLDRDNNEKIAVLQLPKNQKCWWVYDIQIGERVKKDDLMVNLL